MELRTGFGSGGGGRQAAAVVVLCVPCKMVRGGEDLALAYCESGASAFYLPPPFNLLSQGAPQAPFFFTSTMVYTPDWHVKCHSGGRGSLCVCAHGERNAHLPTVHFRRQYIYISKRAIRRAGGVWF